MDVRGILGGVCLKSASAPAAEADPLQKRDSYRDEFV